MGRARDAGAARARLNGGSFGGYITPVLPSVVELYDRIAALETRVADLESSPTGTVDR